MRIAPPAVNHRSVAASSYCTVLSKMKNRSGKLVRHHAHVLPKKSPTSDNRVYRCRTAGTKTVTPSSNSLVVDGVSRPTLFPSLLRRCWLSDR